MIIYSNQRWDSLSGLYTYKMLPWTATPHLSLKILSLALEGILAVYDVFSWKSGPV